MIGLDLHYQKKNPGHTLYTKLKGNTCYELTALYRQGSYHLESGA